MPYRLLLILPLVALLFDSGFIYGGTNRWTRSGLYGNCCISFIFHPINGNLVFGIGDDLDVYRSRNAGLSWSPLNVRALPFPVHTSLPDAGVLGGIHPLDPSRIVIFLDVILTSTDEGKTWKVIGNRPEGTLEDFEFDPTNPKIMYLAAHNTFSPREGFIYKSVDGGVSWKKILVRPYNIRTITFHPVTRDLYTIVDGVVLRSANGGSDWEQISGKIGGGGKFLIIHPTNPDVMYASLDGVFSSDDGGKNWRLLGCGCIVTGLTVDPTNTEAFYVSGLVFGEQRFGNFTVLKSSDGGKTLTQTNLPNMADRFPQNIMVNPLKNNVVLVGNSIFDGGVFRSTSYGELMESDN